MKNLQVQELTLAFADREILRDVSFNMNEKTRCALAGANGCGKSTLLKALTGEIQSDSKKVSITKGARISYLPQSDIVLGEKSVYDTAEEGYSRFQAVLDEIKDCEERTSNGGKEAMSAAERLSELHETLLWTAATGTENPASKPFSWVLVSTSPTLPVKPGSSAADIK